jgi:PAS domain S-box-containing protein
LDTLLRCAPGAFERSLEAWQGLIHPEDLDRVKAQLALHLETDARFETEYGVRRADGSIAWWRDVGETARDASGRAARMFGTCADITELVEAREGLRRSMQTLQSLFGASPMTIVLLDREGRLQFWNPAPERCLGWAAAEILGRTLPSVPPDRVEEHQQLWSRLLAGETMSAYASQRLRRDGSRIDVLICAVGLKDPEGRSVRSSKRRWTSPSWSAPAKRPCGSARRSTARPTPFS